ncbi:dihydropyrimidinase [Bacillus sp. Gen3]|nr:dihydropyrimidinase [Bacillus sp. Gen3]
MSTIVKNGFIVSPTDTFKADIEIENGTIVKISSNIIPSDQDHVINAEDQYVLPGGIDPHAHLAISGTVDDFASGTKAAASGGITSIINFTDPKPDQISFLEDLNEWKKKAENSIIDYGFHSIINRCDNAVLDEISRLPENGVTSIKLFMAYRGTNMVDDMQMYHLMKRAAEVGMITNVHAENGDIIDLLIEEELRKGNTDPIYHAYTRPSQLEAEATNRALSIAEILNAPIYIVHVSSKAALEEVHRAKERGVKVYGETCPHYLVLDEEYLKLNKQDAVKYICSPPLRSKNDQQALWGGIQSSDISVVGSDHASHPYKNGKILGMEDFTKAPNGLPGIEDMYRLLYHFGVHEKRISLQKFVEVSSFNAAKIFGLYPKKGIIQVGSDADIVILDPNRTSVISKQTQFQSTEYNVYEGFEIRGKITHVLSRGEVIVKENVVLGKPGRGKFLHRNKHIGM